MEEAANKIVEHCVDLMGSNNSCRTKQRYQSTEFIYTVLRMKRGGGEYLVIGIELFSFKLSVDGLEAGQGSQFSIDLYPRRWASQNTLSTLQFFHQLSLCFGKTSLQ